MNKENKNVPIHLLSGLPNNEFGKKVIKNIRKFLNRDRYKLRVRGRGTRKEHGNQHSIPLKYAERFSIYVDDDSVNSYHSQRWLELWKEINVLKEKLSKHENYRFYSIHENITSATKTALHLLEKTNSVDIFHGYKVVRTKDNYVLFISNGGENE